MKAEEVDPDTAMVLARQILEREGADLVASVRRGNSAEIEASKVLLTVAIARAIMSPPESM